MDARPRSPECIRPFVATVTRHVRRRLAVDTRSLAALRVALGCILLVDIAHRVREFDTVYAADGVYPIAVHEAEYGLPGLVSIHALSDAAAFQAALFVLAAVFAFAFLVGYRTRLVGAGSLLLLVSLHIRYPVVLNGGDRLLRVLLFVALLTPLGERCSVDALRRGDTREHVSSVGTAALLVQPLVVFTTNALEKRRGEYWYAGDGLELALSDPTMTTAVAPWLLGYPSLVTGLNYGWVGLLAASIPLLLLTVGWARALATLVYLSAFVGMAATLSVGLFPLVLAASVLPFLTATFWDQLGDSMPVDRIADLEGDFRDPDQTAEQPDHRRSVFTAFAAVVLVWMLAFAAIEVAAVEPPSPFDSQHLDQQDWGLYAPDPSESTDWHVTVVHGQNGSTIETFGETSVSLDRPPDPESAYGSFRHRSFMTSVDTSAPDGPIAVRYAVWVCDQTTTSSGGIDRIAVYRFDMSRSTSVDDDFGRTLLVELSCR